MSSRNFYFVHAALALLTFQYCIAVETPDIDLPDLAVEVYSHLVSALEVQLSAGELRKLNANVTEQQLMCIEEMVKDVVKSAEAAECSRKTITKISTADSGGDGVINVDSDEGESGWGDDDNEEESGSGIQTEFASKVFCNEACQSVFLRAYEACGLLPFDDSPELEEVVKDLCRVHDDDEVCFDFVTRFASVSKCTPDQDCEKICELGKEQVSQDSKCCLRYKESELFSTCELSPVQECKNGNTVADSAAVTISSIMILSLSVWVVLLF